MMAADTAVKEGLRPQGGWETVRLLVSHSCANSTREAAILAQSVWPVLSERCAARQLLLLPLDLREGGAVDLLPPKTCMQQVEASAGCNEGRPLLLCVHGGGEGWEPPPEETAMLGTWVHGLTLGEMEAFEAVCELYLHSSTCTCLSPLSPTLTLILPPTLP